MPNKPKMGTRDGRVTREKTTESFGATALKLFGFGGNTAAIALPEMKTAYLMMADVEPQDW